MKGTDIRRMFEPEEVCVIQKLIARRLDEMPKNHESAGCGTEKETNGVKDIVQKRRRGCKEEICLDSLLDDDNGGAQTGDTNEAEPDNKWYEDLIDSFKALFGDLGTLAERKKFLCETNAFVTLPDTALKIQLKMLCLLGYIEPDVLEKVISAMQLMPTGERKRQWHELTARVPWGISCPVEFDIEGIAGELDRTIFGMESAKRKLLEHIALLRFTSTARMEPVLLLGKPGTGKTHLGMALAGALGLPFVKVQMAGSYDVAAWKGCAPTWQSAAPGMMFRMLIDAGCENPVILIDEIDKGGGSSAGHVSTILTELFDTTQNHEYVDVFMQFPVNFSKALFIATANDEESIPAYIRDRCFVINVEPYTKEQRRQIIKKYLPEQLVKEMSLLRYKITVSDAVAGHLAAIDSLRAVKMAMKSLIIKKLMATDGRENRMVLDNTDNDVLMASDAAEKRQIGFNR